MTGFEVPEAAVKAGARVDGNRKPALCTARPLDTLDDCDAPATVVVTAGCVHEHVGRIRWCATHAAAGRAGKADCRACRLAGHGCRLFVQRVDPIAEVA